MFLEIEAPDVLPLVSDRQPATRFTREQVSDPAPGGARGSRDSPRMQHILHHIIQLRGARVSWVFDLPLPRLLERPAQTVRLPRRALIAPLTIFKIEGGLWIPKSIILSCEDLDLDLPGYIALSAACRGSSIETICITDHQIACGYLEGSNFKRAFNGAFFCDAETNCTVFCPTLRNYRLFEWPAACGPAKPGRAGRWQN